MCLSVLHDFLAQALDLSENIFAVQLQKAIEDWVFEFLQGWKE